MTKQKLLLTLTTVIWMATGCGETSNRASQASVATLAACAGQQKSAVDPSNIDINGAPNAKPGDPAQYTLSEDLSCNVGQEVSWRTVAGGQGKGSGSAYVASFKKPGEYVVAAKITDPNSSTPFEISEKTIVSADLAINGPQYGMAELEHSFRLAIPAGITLAAAQWNFGDGSNPTNGTGAKDHTYMTAGQYTVTVNVIATNGDNAVLTHNINVLPSIDGFECVRELSTSGPNQANINTPVTMSVFIPACVAFRVGSVRWTFGDNSATAANQTVTHTYTTAGVYTATVDLFNRENSTTPILTLTRQITVLPVVGDPDPVDPGPVDPLLCLNLGQTRESNGEIFSEDLACGVRGTKTMSYRNRIVQTCQLTGEVRRWVETSRVKELLSEGECKNQACLLPPEALNGVDNVALGIFQFEGKYYVGHGGVKTFYSSQTPAGACTEVAETRTCSNGVLGGSANHVYLMCNNGCPGVGPHGTTLKDVIVGETSVPKVCAFGETGITDLFNTVADKTCTSGEVSTSNNRTGTIKTPGVCPTYSWVGTENYSACSADCGGKQSRTFDCRDNKGEAAPAVRCGENRPFEERICDGNPAAVRRSEVSTVNEDASSSAMCPSNQVGTISKTRVVTTTKVYACINHAVGLESTNTVPGEWVEQKYCKDLVAHRCSQDSLDNNAANGRYKWLLKCRTSVPAIDQFLKGFEAYEKMTVFKMENLVLKGRIVYPTFLNANGKSWLAPRNESGSCAVPEGVYIAAVCLASCSTPEQLILSQGDQGAKGSLKYSSFLEAWNDNFKFVATLGPKSSMSSKLVQRTAVDQWVTELMDGNHEIYEFSMKSGGQLRLTPNHPVLTSEGTMKLAGDWKVGESMVKLGGARDQVVSIRKFNHFGKVYNVFVKSNDLKKNIVVTNGYLNGTAFFQNEGAQHLNRRLFRGALVKGVLDK
jgi:PKD repeat protein